MPQSFLSGTPAEAWQWRSGAWSDLSGVEGIALATGVLQEVPCEICLVWGQFDTEASNLCWSRTAARTDVVIIRSDGSKKKSNVFPFSTVVVLGWSLERARGKQS